MADYNGKPRTRGTKQLIVQGRIGNELEIKRTNDGVGYVEISIPTSDVVKGQEVTTWFKCTQWPVGDNEDRLQFVVDHWGGLDEEGKRKSITIQGTLRLNPWVDRQGVAQAGAEVRISQILSEPHWKKRSAGNEADDSNYGQLVGAGRAKAAPAADPDAW